MGADIENKRIAKNAIMLWIRMLLSIFVSVYTSRVVLQVLGVEDYGIYAVVGGIISMFGFLNAAMSGATSRFLTYEMGRADQQRLQETFSSALLIHIGLAGLVFILAETIGLWFLNTQLQIPESRMGAAQFVYQFTILSMAISFTQVPYNAAIIAHEKMDIYAYIELLNVFLKLGIVYILWIGTYDKLILYSFLVLFVSSFIALLYRFYCLRNFKESHFKWVIKKDILKPMLTFSCWDIFGNMSVTLRAQGTNFLQNIFFGVIVNAAAGLAVTIQGILISFAYNVITAFRPQIIKKYATGDIKSMLTLFERSIKYTIALFIMISLPLYWEAEYVLHLWLGEIPPYLLVFLRAILVYTPFHIINLILNIPIHASGNIKWLSLGTGSIFGLTVLPMYICFKWGYGPLSGYIVTALTYPLVLLSNYLILRFQVKIPNVASILVKNIVANVSIVLIISFLLLQIQAYMPSSFLRLVLIVLISVVSYLAIFFAINKRERGACRAIVIEKIHRFNK